MAEITIGFWVIGLVFFLGILLGIHVQISGLADKINKLTEEIKRKE